MSDAVGATAVGKEEGETAEPPLSFVLDALAEYTGLMLCAVLDTTLELCCPLVFLCLVLCFVPVIEE